MEKHVLTVGSFAVNCTILSEDDRAYLVDPGQEADRLVAELEKRALHPVAILLTHAHFDHIGAVPELQRRYPGLPVYLGEADHAVITHPFNAYPPDYPAIAKPSDLRPATDLQRLLPSVRVIDTPGHTPGGVCYYFAEDRRLLSGDTLFARSIGRTDLPGGSLTTLAASLEVLKQLPDETEVIPGHGDLTTIGNERRHNPFLKEPQEEIRPPKSEGLS